VPDGAQQHVAARATLAVQKPARRQDDYLIAARSSPEDRLRWGRWRSRWGWWRARRSPDRFIGRVDVLQPPRGRGVIGTAIRMPPLDQSAIGTASLLGTGRGRHLQHFVRRRSHCVLIADRKSSSGAMAIDGRLPSTGRTASPSFARLHTQPLRCRKSTYRITAGTGLSRDRAPGRRRRRRRGRRRRGAAAGAALRNCGRRRTPVGDPGAGGRARSRRRRRRTA
jgi:hypothetical protein